MIKIFRKISSTNDYIKENKDSLPPGTLIVAKEQTKGRGRMGRTWNSKPGLGLYFSLFLCPEISIEKFSQISIVAGFSIAKVLRSYGLSPLIKWPNDVLISGKKISGILNELVFKDDKPFLIVGIGMNILHKKDDFPDDLRTPPTSLFMETGNFYDNILVLKDILKVFKETYEDFLLYGLDDENINKFLYKGKMKCVIQNELREVDVKKITPFGKLSVSYRGMDIELESGELI